MSHRRIALLLLFLALAAASFVERVESRLTPREAARLREGKAALERLGLVIGRSDGGSDDIHPSTATVAAAASDRATATVAAVASDTSSASNGDRIRTPSNRQATAAVAAAASDPTGASTASSIRISIGTSKCWWCWGGGGGGSTKKSTGGSTIGFMRPYSGRVPSYAAKSVSFKGGAVMSQPLEVYLIWHGTWPASQKTPIQKFVDSISEATLANKPGSVKDWWNINRLYKSGATFVTPTVSRSNTEIDVAAASAASGQTPLKKADLLALINFQILSGSLPRISSAVYVILTSSDVDVDGFGSDFCAFHDASGSIKWAWVGMPDRFLARCTHAVAAGLEYPNGDRILDGAISNFAHVLSETVVNPKPGATWADDAGNENVDLCADIWGTEYLTDDSPAVQYNTVGVDDYKFFLPTILNPSTGFCMNGLSVLPGVCGTKLFNYPCDTGGV
ncbi:hypothetical protein CLOM_g9539 [Closterium sp. NIES-68]|nr:hypothetical protein CLOM_g9539 [Closterium sp. NIES-68]GJP61171.1 hypothetical protein CLOP_g18363 [Closterium sp. NIES-67]